MQNKFEHELGKLAKDKVTGFKGIIMARIEFLTGCNRYALQPTELLDSKPIESVYFDEAQVEVIGEGISPTAVTGKERGACAPNPKKY